jgi:LPXTG-motif cell wall-anchored protein
MFNVDLGGIIARIGSMALDVKKAAEEKANMLLTYLGIGGIILIIVGLYLIFRKK